MNDLSIVQNKFSLLLKFWKVFFNKYIIWKEYLLFEKLRKNAWSQKHIMVELSWPRHKLVLGSA